MEDSFLVLCGVTSRYLLGDGLVQEALFINNQTGEEFSLGLVEGQYEALLEILRANNGDTAADTSAEEAAQGRELERDTDRRPSRDGGSSPSALSSTAARAALVARQARKEEIESVEFEEAPEDEVDYAEADEIRSAFARGI